MNGLGWFTRWRRARTLRNRPLDAQSWAACLQRFSFLRALDAADRQRLHDQIVLFLADKSIQGAGGLTVTADMRLLIAAQACLLILNLDFDYYRDWVEIIVYPDEFVTDHEYTDDDGIVHRMRSPISGEAWDKGPVILSWRDADAADSGFGYNVVMHEFAHKIDMLNGEANGFPPLHAEMDRVAWTEAFSSAYADFRRRLEAREETRLDAYAAEDPGEFFAVLSEMFFEMPLAVRDDYPGVYAQMAAFYRQDPARRIALLSSVDK